MSANFNCNYSRNDAEKTNHRIRIRMPTLAASTQQTACLESGDAPADPTREAISRYLVLINE